MARRLFWLSLAGGIAVLLNAWWTGPELQYGLNDSGAKIAIVDRERLERLFEHLHNCPALERIFVSRESEEVAHPQVTKLETIIGDVSSWHLLPDRALPNVALDPEDDATILYTSGTTGKPKGALGTHRNSTTAVLVRPFGQARRFAARRAGAGARSERTAKVLALGRAAVSYNRLPRGDGPVARCRRQTGVDAQVGAGTGNAADRTRAGDQCGRRADHRLAIA